MGDRDGALEGGKSAGQRRYGVALNDDPVRLFVLEDATERCHGAGEEAVQRLVARHEAKVDIDRNSEEAKWLVEQFAMLAGDTQTRGHCVTGLERLKDRRHLDR